VEKKALKTWDAIVLHAQERAKKSLKRKDPIAWAYWQQTEQFAKSCSSSYVDPGIWPMAASGCVHQAKEEIKKKNFMIAALWYSRAKWFVIIARANGIVMDPAKTGVNLKWLEEFEKGVHHAIARPVAATY